MPIEVIEVNEGEVTLDAYSLLQLQPDPVAAAALLVAASELSVDESLAFLASVSELSGQVDPEQPAAVLMEASSELEPDAEAAGEVQYAGEVSSALSASAQHEHCPVADLSATSALRVVMPPQGAAVGMGAISNLVAGARLTMHVQAFLDSSTQASTALHWPSVAFLRGLSKLTANGIPRTFGLAAFASESRILLDMRGGVDTPWRTGGVAAMLTSVGQLYATPLGSNSPLGSLARPITIRDCPGGRYPVPFNLDFPALRNGLWFAFRATADSTITFNWAGAADVFVQGYQAQGMATNNDADITLVDVDATELALGVSAGLYYHICVLPQKAVVEDGKFWIPANSEWLGGSDTYENWIEDASLAWWCDGRGEMMGELIVSDPIVYGPLPGALFTEVFNASPNTRCSFIIDGALIAYLSADDSGQILAAMLTLPVLAPGMHSLLVCDDASGRIREVSFSTGDVERMVEPWPLYRRPQVPGAAPGVPRWAFLDSRPGGEVYFLATNPETMSNPHKARVITAEHSSAVTGQVLLFEGSPGAAEWTFEGWCRSVAEQAAMERFQARQRRLWIVDHLRRAWLCSFEALEWTEVKNGGNELRKYRAKVFIYDGPVKMP